MKVASYWKKRKKKWIFRTKSLFLEIFYQSQGRRNARAELLVLKCTVRILGNITEFLL